MAAPSLIFFPQPETLRPVHDFEAETNLERIRAAATIARDRIAEIDGVRVLGPEVKSDTSQRPPGDRPARHRQGRLEGGLQRWPAAASRSTPPRNRVIVVRLTEEDVADATHHRLASALQLALWATA